MKICTLTICLFLSFFSLLPQTLTAAESTPVELKDVGIQEHLGEQITLSLPFLDQNGNEVTLAKYFHKDKAVLFAFVYYECPGLCTFVLNGMINGLRDVQLTPGNDFEIVVVSIDSTETPALAKEKLATYLKMYGKNSSENGWHFLTGSEESIQQITKEIGFSYIYDAEQKQFAHASAIYTLTPNGKISRYLFGIEYAPRDLKLALLEASEGKLGNLIDKLLLYCYHYDPKGKKYALLAVNIMKIAGVITLLGLGILIHLLMKKRKKAERL